MRLSDLFGVAARRSPRVDGVPVEADEDEGARLAQLAAQYSVDDTADASLERLEVASKILKNMKDLLDDDEQAT